MGLPLLLLSLLAAKTSGRDFGTKNLDLINLRMAINFLPLLLIQNCNDSSQEQTAFCNIIWMTVFTFSFISLPQNNCFILYSSCVMVPFNRLVINIPPITLIVDY